MQVNSVQPTTWVLRTGLPHVKQIKKWWSKILSNLLLGDKIEKERFFIKKIESAQINSTSLPSKSWDHDNLIESK
jgi:hypothetical protein